MSEQKPDPVSGDLSAGSVASLDASAPSVATPSELAAKGSTSQIEPAKPGPELAGPVEPPKNPPSNVPKDAPKVESARTDAPRPTGRIMIMSPSHDDAWSNDAQDAASDQATRPAGMFGKRRISALAAVVVFAAVSGAIGGALAVAGLAHFNGSDETKSASVQNPAVEESITRIDAELAAQKQHGAAQSAKIFDRIDKLERAQAEPAAKLARLSEMVEKLRATPPPVPAPVASIPAKETTGSIQPPIPTPMAKPEIARLPTVEGWVLRDVANGSAMIEGRQGLYEVFAGDPVPGLGRVDAIRRQDGRWVVVTSKGLIVAR